MKHRILGKKLGRNTNQRRALFRIQLRSLFNYGFINTTRAKAQAIRSQAEKMALLATKADLNSRKALFDLFQDRNFVNQICSVFPATFPAQKQNFTRLRNVKYRQGDNALIVRLFFAKDLTTPAKSETPTVPTHAKFKKAVKKADRKPALKKTKKETK